MNLEAMAVTGYKVSAAYCRVQSRHGGTMILLRTDTNCSEVGKIKALSVERQIEVVGVLIEKMNTLIVSVYRPPTGSIEIFMNVIRDILTYISEKYNNAKIIIAGDLNINFLSDSAEKRDLICCMLSHDLHFVFEEPSRVSRHTQTCIDQIFTNLEREGYLAATVQPHLSDHYAQTLRIPTQSINPEKAKKYVTIRRINETNTYSFIDVLKNENWKEIVNSEPQEHFSAFHARLMKCRDAAFPEETVPARNNENFRIDWHTRELGELKANLDALHVVKTVANTESSKLEYENARKNYREQIKKIKSNAITDKIKASNNKQNIIWKVINSEVGRKKYSSAESRLTADNFSKYFSGIGGSISSTIVGPVNSPSLFMASHNPTVNGTIFMRPATENEIGDIIKGLKNRTTKDIYSISAQLLESICHLMVGPLTELVNGCLLRGVFPKELKIAKVVPIHKTGSIDEAKNYRPISILPVISKVFETVVKTRIVGYLEKIDMFASEQHGYREKRSTVSAIMDMLERIVEAFDAREELQLLCTDLSKAFDSVDHSILIQKLEYWGISGPALDLLRSYLSDRKQVVYWNGETSESADVVTGVPQGSILGPVLFIIYINDLPNNVRCEGAYLYADDASFLIGVDGIDDKSDTTEMVLAEANEWFAANSLKMNSEKTRTLVFSTKAPEKKSLSFLGVHISNDLSWGEHISCLQRRLASSIFAIRRIRHVAGSEAAKIAYFGCFHSKAIYGIILWGSCGAAAKIFIQQKEAVRAVVGATRTTSCREIFSNLKILTLPACYILTSLTYVHNSNKFTTHSDIHNHNTRHKHNIAYASHRISKTQAAGNHLALKLYNGIPHVLKCLPPQKFKAALRKVLLENAIYSIQEFVDLRFPGS